MATDSTQAACWKDWEEWKDVYKMLYSFDDKASQINGLKLVDVWRSRTAAKLPIAVECTACLVAADIGLAIGQYTCSKNRTRSLSIAMGIVRFVNGMVDQVQKGMYARSVQSIAEEIDIPDWLVDIRHESTHADLPSIDILEAGLGFALQWLKVKYWEETYDSIFTAEQTLEEDMEKLLHDYFAIQLSNVKSKENKHNSCMAAVSKLLTNMDRVRTYFLPSLLKDGLFFPNNIQLRFLLKDNDTYKAIHDFIDLWFPLIKLIQTKFSSFMLDLLKELTKFSRDTTRNSKIFVESFILKLMKEQFLGLKNVETTNILLRYCLQNPSEGAYNILENIRLISDIDKNVWKNIKGLFVIISTAKGIFECPNSDGFSGFIFSGNENMLDYFDKNSINGVDLKELETKLKNGAKEVDRIKSWTPITWIDWSEVPIGSYLNEFCAKKDFTFPILPSEIDELYEVAISRIPSRKFSEEDGDLEGESHVIYAGNNWTNSNNSDVEMMESETLDNGGRTNYYVDGSEEIKRLKDSIVLF